MGPGILNIFFVAAGLGVLVALWAADILRPGSFRRGGRRDLGPWPWWAWALGLFLTLVAGAMGAGLADAFFSARPRDDLARLAIVSLAGGLSSIGVGLLLLSRGLQALIAPERPGPMGARPRLTIRSLGMGVLALLLTVPVVQTASLIAVLITTALRGYPPSPIAHETLRALVDQPGNPWVWVLAATAVVIAPISEELVFRGFLQSICLRVLRSPWAAILVTSALFALVHLGAGIPEGQEHAIAPIFVLGLAMGIAYERTRNLVVPIVMHMGFNALNVVAAVALG